MIQTGFESRVKVQQIIESQLPEFVLDESPKTAEFLKQYYISQEYQSGTVDIAENLDQYLKLDNFTPEVVVGYTGLSTNISSSVGIITVTSTKGFPQKYGLLKIDDEIITYTGITTNTFTGCIRGFSGITSYHQDLDSEELIFSSSSAESHTSSSKVQNLSSLFLQEFYKKIKYSLTPGLENLNFVPNLNVGNFIKEAKTLYQSKGTNESFRILFNVLFGETPKVIDLEQFLIKPSSASYLRRKVIVVEALSGDPLKLKGQTIFKKDDVNTTASVSEVELIGRGGKDYYKLLVFIGYDDAFSTITGKFEITGNTKNTKIVSIGSSVITVDSTIGFPKSGTLYYNDYKITYTDKSINQFFGCSGIITQIPLSSLLVSGETYYGYEDGDETQKVEFRINGVLSSYDSSNDSVIFEEGDFIGVQNIGENINISETTPSYKEIFASSWKYNTSFNFASSSFVPLEYDKITCDVQNVYNENDGYMYVASNSLPSYEITKNIFSYNATGVSDQNINNGLYSKIVFSQKISFLTGSEVYYQPSGQPISGLSEGVYYVEVFYPDVLNQPNRSDIRLYLSSSVIGTVNYVEFGDLTPGTHNFILRSQKEGIISPQKILRKFPLSVNIGDGQSEKTKTGGIGLLINGVEIASYKSDDKVYYGPIKKVNVLSGGKEYDVINPPGVFVSTGSAKLQPVVKGSVKKIYIEPQNFDVDIVVTASLTGANGKGASLEPVVKRRRREIVFDSRLLEYGGGVDAINETITFKDNHGLIDGEPITYRPGNNPELGIGPFKGSNFNSGNTLTKEGVYYTKYISDKTIQLYESIADFNSGINTVGFTTIGTSGVQKFATSPKNTLAEIKVLNEGEGYTNRKLIVSASGISTTNHTISFNNHGFNSGELVVYDYQSSPISGLSTSNQYYVIKLDDNTFRLSNAGIGGTSKIDYDRNRYVRLNSTGIGYQIFNYPKINVDISYSSVGLGSTQFKGTISATPIVRGKIEDIFVYENGSDYGSTILNYHKKPQIQIKTGTGAQLAPIISNGSIKDIIVQYTGSEYYSEPNIEVSGSGSGAILKPILSNNKIVDVIIINPGAGYSYADTIIKVTSTGKNAILDPEIRSLTVNNNKLYNTVGSNKDFTDEIIKSSYNNLQYSICEYSGLVQTEFGDTAVTHSPIIGWAYDGNPIYGSYGYSDPKNKNSQLKRLKSGYSLNISNIENRPSEFPEGFFIEDYKFTNSGDLDQCNGRFCFTKEFPNGVYAYFATSTVNSNNFIVGSFPYFIGDEYRSKFVKDNQSLNQTFDFNNSNLIRNTHPYISDPEYSTYDFTQSINQVSVVESISSGSIEDIEIIDAGIDYKIGDSLEVDESNSGGGGLLAEVSEIKGKEIVNLQTSVKTYDNSVFTWEDKDRIRVTILPSHELRNSDYVNISGFTTSLSFLNGYHKVGVSSFSSLLVNNLPSSGIVTDIYVLNIPENVSIGSSIKIGLETLKVLNIFNDILRVVRGNVSLSHTSTTPVYFTPNSFTIDKSSDYFDSSINDIVYFNPKYSIGVGTTSGIGIAVTNNIGIQTNNIISIPTQSIYLPNHPFKTNQELILKRPQSTSVISVAQTSGSSPFNLLVTDTQKVYAIRKSVDYIGIVTQIGLTTSTNGLYFITNGSDNYQYSLESNYNQIKGNVENISTLVTLSTSHQLSVNDTISLNVKPNLSVGIGTSTSIKVIRDNLLNYILINPISFNSSGINTSTNEITSSKHNLKTGDKVKYTANVVASGLSTDFYYVYKVDDNRIKLCETYNDSIISPPNTIVIKSTGGSNQKIYLVNPQIKVIKNNNLVFDLTDSSLVGYQFKLFYDNKFKDEFVSVGNTNSFSIVSTGTIGVSTNASISLIYDDQIPFPLFYSLEKSGYISTSDKTVKNYSEITFIDSNYHGSHKVFGIGTTTFLLSLSKSPEKTSYRQNECNELNYVTTSTSDSGSVSKIRIISPGYNFKKLPIFSKINSQKGKNCNINLKSNSIGKIIELKITDEGFDYSSDKTLKPKSKNDFKNLDGYFNVNFSTTKNIGWSDNIGKLSEDTQVLPDNDYYQNLSYTVKSSQEWSTIVSPVNGLLHTAGLKNFSDTEIINNSNLEITSSEYSVYLFDLINENRVDTINNFDLVKDVSVGIDTSEYLRFKSKRFTDYIQCRTNRVLEIDDISSKFAKSEESSISNPYLLVELIAPSRKYEKYLVQMTNNDFSKVQFTELIILTDEDDIYTLEKGSISSGFTSETGYDPNLGNLYGYKDELKNTYLRFEPLLDVYNTSYNIKYLNTAFKNFTTGIGSTSIGFITMTGVTTTVSYGSTCTLVRNLSSDIKSIYSEINILNNDTKQMNYIEIFLDHDGTNTNLSEFYFDTSNEETSSNFIGSFGASISGGILEFNYTNNTNNSVTIRSKNIGFGTTDIGEGIYRFKSVNQPDGSERSVNYSSLYSNVSSASTVVDFDRDYFSSVKSIIRIGIGQTSALHQVMMISDSTNVYVTQYPFLSVGSTSGIGTFGAEIEGSTASLKFYPDDNISGDFEILSFNQIFYKENDFNIPLELSYGNIGESMKVNKYFALNDPELNKLDFDLFYKDVPIFSKSFDPSNSNILNLSTGEFNIPHFFSTGEELIYKPNSTFVGVAASAMRIQSTLNHVGVITDILPSKVYAYRVSSDKFKISTRKDYALSGICVTFTSVGSGNAHEFEMFKKNEKTIITIDNVIQSPLAYSLLNYTVDNGGSIDSSATIFGLSGISSIKIGDILKVDNEYMRIENLGLGTSYAGPITFSGNIPLVEVKRSFVGSSATSHSNSSVASIYRGSYNIFGNKIYFTEPPDGSLEDQVGVDIDNLLEYRSSFNGRVFLKSDYEENTVYDDISENFTGIGKTFTLTVGGINTVGLGTSGGNGIVIINGVYQTPTTENNPDNNFRIVENAGISSIIFSGIRTETGVGNFISDFDVNMNQLPRGGLIVSLGSTPGLGYAPLVGASVTAVVSGGVITSIGIGTSGNWGSGYRSPVSIAVTDSTGSSAVISANVGAGGTLSFTVSNGGSNYTNPSIIISPPNYENLPVIGVSRLGIGLTTDTGYDLLLNVEVGASSTTGIGSTLFEVTDFKITRSGYGFKKGDVIKPIGLVTAYGLDNPLQEFELTILDTFNDSFSAWQFGKLDYIDSIKNLQNGSRTVFPLIYNSQLLSFEKSDPDIDFDSLLIIFINGILQKPGAAYQFDGGTSFTFSEAPEESDDVDIFFYRGTDVDSQIFNITETIKPGDSVQVFKSNQYLQNTITQDKRIVVDITTSDTLQTELYNLQGIDIENYKPVNWTKQKNDLIINNQIISKSRDSIESQVYPTAKIIKDLNSNDTEIYVENVELFNYENELIPQFNALIVSGTNDPVSAAVTAVISSAGTVQSLVINSPGSGYVGASIDAKISAPSKIGVGIGFTATATISIVNGSLNTPIVITNPGLGYTFSAPPQVIIPLPDPVYENILDITSISGSYGNIIGIASTSGIGTSLAIKFTIDPSVSPFNNWSVGQPIYIFDTKVGQGVTSIYSLDNQVVGVGTIFLDNIYNISAFNASVGIITCNVLSNSYLVGIATTGSSIGKFSWGKLSGFSRSSSPISIGVSGYIVDSGLSTFPTIQRRGYGLRGIGPIKKEI
jgi:hypothetical protein